MLDSNPTENSSLMEDKGYVKTNLYIFDMGQMQYTHTWVFEEERRIYILRGILLWWNFGFLPTLSRLFDIIIHLFIINFTYFNFHIINELEIRPLMYPIIMSRCQVY